LLIKYYFSAEVCSGSGTTGIVAHQLGRKYIGIEKEEKFLKIKYLG